MPIQNLTRTKQNDPRPRDVLSLGAYFPCDLMSRDIMSVGRFVCARLIRNRCDQYPFPQIRSPNKKTWAHIRPKLEHKISKIYFKWQCDNFKKSELKNLDTRVLKDRNMASNFISKIRLCALLYSAESNFAQHYSIHCTRAESDSVRSRLFCEWISKISSKTKLFTNPFEPVTQGGF